MATTYKQYAADGTNRNFGVTFAYIDRSYVHVYVDGVETTAYTWVNDGMVQLATAPASGALVEVRRITPTGVMPVDFEDGSILSEDQLDTVARFSAHLSEEARDYSEDSARLTKVNDAFDIRGKGLANVAPGTQPTDGVNKAQLDAVVDAVFDDSQAAADSAAASQQSRLASEAARNAAQGIADKFGNVDGAVSAAQASASAAATSAADSAGNKLASEAARTGAEAAQVAAAAAANMRPSTAAAIADATLPNGAYFSVPSTTFGVAAEVYQKSGGVAVATNIKLPNTDLVPKASPNESGYVWALVDSSGRIALGVDASGAVTINGDARLPAACVALSQLDAALQDTVGRVPAILPEDTGYVYAIMDAQKRLAFGVKPTGEVTLTPSAETLSAFGTLTYLSPAKDIYYHGDSLTDGAGGQTTWRQVLMSTYATRQHFSSAVGGQTSTQIAARAGAYPSLLTVAGNQIPASGGVAVTARTVSLLTDQGNQSITGWLGGVYGTLSRAGDDSYTFTRFVAGSAVKVGAKMPFMPDIQGHDFWTQIIFVGRNNLATPSDVMRDIAALVNLQKPAEKRFLILTPTNGGTLTAGQSTGEGTGSSTLANIKAIEDWAVQAYGDRVLKLREFSFQFNNGTADDLDDVAKETVPRSLRIDSVHFTTAFHAQIANFVMSEINRRGW